MILSRARVALAALSAPALCLLLVTASAQEKPKPTAKKPQPTTTVNRRLSRGEYVARQALSFRGVPYRFGGRSRNGVDCSGLIQTVWKKYGLMLPRTSVEQFKTGIPVPKDKMKPGDLVFFKNTYKRGISHVGIFVGEGKFVHAANSRKGVILLVILSRQRKTVWGGSSEAAALGKRRQAAAGASRESSG